MAFQPSLASQRSAYARLNDQKKDGQADVDKQWADYVKCANEAIQKGTDFYHPLGVAFHPSATTKRTAFQKCQDKWSVFERAVAAYNAKFAAGSPVSTTKFTLATTSVTQVVPAEFMDQTAVPGQAAAAPALPASTIDLSQLPPPPTESGMGMGTMIALGAVGLLLVGGGIWFMTRSGEEEEEED